MMLGKIHFDDGVHSEKYEQLERESSAALAKARDDRDFILSSITGENYKEIIISAARVVLAGDLIAAEKRVEQEMELIGKQYFGLVDYDRVYELADRQITSYKDALDYILSSIPRPLSLMSQGILSDPILHGSFGGAEGFKRVAAIEELIVYLLGGGVPNMAGEIGGKYFNDYLKKIRQMALERNKKEKEDNIKKIESEAEAEIRKSAVRIGVQEKEKEEFYERKEFKAGLVMSAAAIILGVFL